MSITTSQIHYEKDYIRIFVPTAKNDVYREGNYVYIKKLCNKYCPVNVLQRYIKDANASSEPSLPIFRSLRFFRLSKLSEAILQFKECLQELGYDEKKYGLHIPRSGGATAAANNRSVPERLLKIHRQWKTDAAKDIYVHESVKNRLHVTESLGL